MDEVAALVPAAWLNARRQGESVGAPELEHGGEVINPFLLDPKNKLE